MKMKLPSASLVVFALFLLCITVAFGETDPRVKECKHQCRIQQKLDERQKRECIQRCDERYHQGDTDNVEEREQYGKRQGQQQQEQTPYVFQDHHFTTGIHSQRGRVRVLPRFTQRSELLSGIDAYRFAVLEAEPNTFVIPNHFDSDAIFFVVNGKGTVAFVHEDITESVNIRRGDIVRVFAGITTYLINRDNNDKLVLAKLLQPVFSPGSYVNFFGTGGGNVESYFRALSKEILEAAFNTRSDKFERIFGQQREVFREASQEQIKALSQHKEGGGIWPFHGESKATFNIFEKRPSQSNQYGQLYEVDSNEYRRLQDLDVAISLANISRGGMTVPIYNSRATKIAFVINGQGYFEMACPHLSGGHQGGEGSQQEHGGSGSQGETGGTPRYQKVNGPLTSRTTVIIPPGHPFVAVASKKQNLEMVCFEINAFRNQKIPLAGKKNVFKQLASVAKELAFGVPAREVDEVFANQQLEQFVKGPGQEQQHEGRAEA